MNEVQRIALVQRLETQAVAARRQALAVGWALVDAEALLRLAPSLEHIDLCVQSLMVAHCIESAETTAEELEETISFALGRIASWSSMEHLDIVLTQHVPWLRVLELAWLCRAYTLVHLLFRDVLCDRTDLLHQMATADSAFAAAKSLDT
jgi:hypothetical protein